ncbi:MAG: HAD-IIA family hydrolase [Bifidobacteriaceae bacterium]|jgi:HAD superfamily hydrolase (TIGR01450 family)|nr:HAD-IIA family hydrolase [Bifidobacteriaceae bacterium]
MSDTAQNFTHPGLKSSGVSLAERYGLGLLDLDGVVYRGKNPVEHAAEGIMAAEKAGMFVSYTTNNAARYQKTVAEQIESFGITVAPGQIITSAIVASRMLAKHLPQGATVLVVGADHLREEVKKTGLRVVESAADNPDAVIQGWHAKISWEELAQAAYAVERGAQFYVTNRDLTIPRELGIAPGNGAMVGAVVATTGVTPIASAGKPESAMYDEARAMNADEGYDLVPTDRSLPVGDRLDTDIEAANRGGYDSLVVLTGVADPQQLLVAEPIQRPTYISRDLRGLTEIHNAPQRVGENRYRLGNMTAQYSNHVLAVASVDSEEWHDERNGVSVSTTATNAALHSLDAVRAACALAWNLADRGVDMSAASLPQFDLSAASHSDGE